MNKKSMYKSFSVGYREKYVSRQINGWADGKREGGRERDWLGFLFSPRSDFGSEVLADLEGSVWDTLWDLKSSWSF